MDSARSKIAAEWVRGYCSRVCISVNTSGEKTKECSSTRAQLRSGKTVKWNEVGANLQVSP
uniref:Uncharacterized protein n=1 Tax=Arundo donax TaxID=35708 RepID=A0A0A9G9T8_ARUDO